jgi:multidrug efflux pump subunit AcrB/outer membrane protein TolC
MSLTRLAFRYRSVTYLLTCLVMVLGIAGLFSMSRREDPDLKGRFAQIIAVYPGASAEQVEELVGERIERTLREVDDIGVVTTTARPGVAVIQVEAADRMTGTLEKMMDDIRERMADVRANLPAGVIDIAVNDRFADTSALILGVTQAGVDSRELEESAKRLRDRLRLLPEVAEARLIGEQPEVITVSLSARRLAAIGEAVTVEQISNAIARENVLPNIGGSVTSGAARLTIAPTGNFQSLSDLEAVVVGSIGGSSIYLRDIGTVQRGYADPASFRLRVNGEPSVGLTLTMRKGQNITTLGEKAKEVIAEVQKELPAGTVVHIVNDLPRSVEHRVEGFFHELQFAVLIIFAIMLLFMGGRSAALVGGMLPISMLGTFAVMWLTGRDIQQMSIAALIIALALVVDNSIVVLDNIEEKMAEGQERWEASVEGAEEITNPLLVANLVAVTSFLPLAFLPGGVGDFIRDLGLVTSLSIGVSVFLNLTVLPILCYHFLKPVHGARQNLLQRTVNLGVDGLRHGGAWLAQRALRRPGLTVGVAALLLVGAVGMIPQLGFSFFPSAERDQFVVDVWLPEGRDIQTTERSAAKVEEIIQKQPGVRSVVTYVGQGGPRFYYNVTPEAPTPNYAQIIVNTDSMRLTEKLVKAVQEEANRTIAEARVTAKKLEQGPPIGAPIAIRITGDSITELRRIGSEIKTVLNETPGTHSVHDNYGELPLHLRVRVDEDRAALLGVSTGAVAQTARLAFTGQTVSRFREGDKEIPIDLRLRPEERANPNDLLNLYVGSPNGAIALRQVAELELAPETPRIVRRNAERTLTVFAFSDGSRLPSAIVADVQKRLKGSILPEGFRIGYGGESEETGKSFGNMGVVFGAAIVVNIALLVLLFGSFTTVGAILSAVPLGVIGAVLGLFLAQQNFGFMAFLGIAALGGIVTNHTIFLFFYAREEQQQGASMTEALVEAGRRRLRPILLTVLLSVGALLPQAFSGSKLWPPLDWALIAGLLVSMVLTLVVAPSVYALLTRDTKAIKGGEGTVPVVATLLTLMLWSHSAVQAQTPSNPETTLTLEQAIAQGMVGNRRYQLARQEADRAMGRRNETRSSLNPTVGVSAGYVRLNRGQNFSFGGLNLVGAYPDQANYVAQATLPVDISGLLRTAVRVSDLQRLITELEAQALRNQLVLEIRAAYYNVLRAKSLQIVALTALENAQTRLRDAEKAQEAGIVPRFDVIRAQTGVASAEQTRIQAENRVRLAQSALNELIGLPISQLREVQEPDTTRLLEEPIASDSVPNKELLGDAYNDGVQKAVANRPEVQAVAVGVRATELGITLARRSITPTLGAQVAAQYNPNAGAFQQRSLVTFGVTLAIPIGDGGLARARKQQAVAENASAITTQQQVIEQITLEVQQVYLTRREAYERLRVAQKALQQAQEAARMARIRYQSGITREGISPLLEVSDAQTAQAEAESNLTNALYDVLTTEAQWEKALGTNRQ